MGSGFWVGFFAALAIALPGVLLGIAHGAIRVGRSAQYRRLQQWITRHQQAWSGLLALTYIALGVVEIKRQEFPLLGIFGLVLGFLIWHPRTRAWLTRIDEDALFPDSVAIAESETPHTAMRELPTAASPGATRDRSDRLPSATELRRAARDQTERSYEP